MAESDESRGPVMPRAVLLVDPNKQQRDKGAAVLDALGFEPRLAADAFEAHALIDGTAAVVASHPAALELYPRLRTMGIPFVASVSARQARPAAIAHHIGADAFVIRPYKKDMLSIALFAAANARMLRDRALRAELALADVSGVRRSDSTSGMLHIDLFKTLLPLEIRRARRHGYPIAICVVSLDPLPKAKEVTAEMATACEPFIRGAVRDVDLAVRYGDGRFLVFLPHTDLRGAEAVGRRIVSEIRNCRLRAGGVEMILTASVGIATPRPGKPPSFARLIRDAHAAVKAAQLKGGDRAVVRS
jgi:diguanylate cyclase (GGDEF)-like protein